LFITLGRMDNISRQDMIQILAEESGIPEESVGNMNIYEKFSFVEVAEEWANYVINGLHRQIIRGRRISIEPARGRS
jgi:ATP-dependent RNA helicase DeaD